MAKIVSFKTACNLSKKFKKEGKKVVFTSGCFDIFHLGHIRFLNKTKAWGGKDSIFFLGLENDGYIRGHKPNRPVFLQKQRAEVLLAISIIDYIILFDEDNPTTKDFMQRKKLLAPNLVSFGEIGRKYLYEIRKESKLLNFKFRHLPSGLKSMSSTRLVDLILNDLPS